MFKCLIESLKLQPNFSLNSRRAETDCVLIFFRPIKISLISFIDKYPLLVKEIMTCTIILYF